MPFEKSEFQTIPGSSKLGRDCRDCCWVFTASAADFTEEGTPSVVQGPVDQSSSQSADAARAARMSRVGTKAGMETCEVLEMHTMYWLLEDVGAGLWFVGSYYERQLWGEQKFVPIHINYQD